MALYRVTVRKDGKLDSYRDFKRWDSACDFFRKAVYDRIRANAALDTSLGRRVSDQATAVYDTRTRHPHLIINFLSDAVWFHTITAPKS